MEYIEGGGGGQTEIKLLIEESLNITQGSRFASVILFIKNNVKLASFRNEQAVINPLEMDGPNKQ